MKPHVKNCPPALKKNLHTAVQKLGPISGIRRKSSAKKQKHQQQLLKQHWKTDNPLVTQVRKNPGPRPPQKRVFFSSTDDSPNDESPEENNDFSNWRNGTNNEENNSDEESGSDSESEEYSNVEEKPKNVLKTFLSVKTGVVVIVANHPTSFAINGTASIRVISGTAHVLGYDLDVTKAFVPVYSARNICHLRVETTSCQEKTLIYREDLGKLLDEIAFPSQVELMQNVIGDTSVVIVLKKNYHASFVEFARKYIPSALPLSVTQNPSSGQMANLGFTIGASNEFTVKLSEAHGAAADVIKFDINTYLTNNNRGSTPRIMVYGQKGLGKSTSLRYFMNKAISANNPYLNESWSERRVFCLDIDLGQAEFTLPGCISLTEVNTPLTGPSYTHLKAPTICKFFGSLTIDTAGRYFSILEEVMNYYLMKWPKEILFINTLGWIKDLGLEAINFVRNLIQPSIEIELFRSSDGSEACGLDVQNIKPFEFPRYLRIPSNIVQSTNNIVPATRRSIQILSYFGKLQVFSESLKTLNSFTPYCISAINLAIHVIHGENMEFEQLLNMVNGSIVALCIVENNKLIHPVENDESMRIIPGSHFGDCVGFGIVRGMNFKEKLLNILTPLEFHKLRNVNALVKGHLQMPDVVFLKQNLAKDCEAPYLQTATPRTALEKKVKRRTFREKAH